ncbi:sensor histidine kinase [Mucilaginibacter pedocola]|uniref:histidine kinase n=1 Tax=Mucilaginibacter pedocola TaxID=1792845 RepID=A0A1S9PFG1_9SPHI|nr:ATP-binding protein [Mucilaginibacter pedocola]OOQ59649.1 hypothetical protein BC343_05660 [Mucilaginibacter pedocola]
MRKLLLFKFSLVVPFLLFCASLCAQQNPIKPAFDFPTKEVYDLHVDKHGFIWIASDFGVARYDGINCVHYSNPNQISLGCSNLLEDSYGRIWFNNFNGQIFYIDHEKVNLLESYDYKKEGNYPRMVLFGNQLLATSDHGLFVLDTKTLTGKYIGDSTYTSSLAVMSKQVLIRGNNKWYAYNGTPTLKKLSYKGDDESKGIVYALANKAYRDTAYMLINPAGVVKKLVLQNDTVKQVSQTAYNTFINTITITPDNQWVNTNGSSYSLNTGEEIKGLNLSCTVTDMEGNRWFSSLYHGLLIQYKKDIAHKTTIPGLDADDLVVSLRSYKNQLMLGTQKGYLVLYDPASNKVNFKSKLAAIAAPINNLAWVGGDEFIAASSVATYRVNALTKTITELTSIKTAKQFCYDSEKIYIASTSGLYVLPRQRSEALNKQIAATFGNALKYSEADNNFYLRMRARAIAYYPEQAALFVTFKNTLYKIDKTGMNPFLFNGQPVYAASLAYLGHRLYVGTISNGMLIVEQDGIKHISVQNGLFSKSIFKLKAVDKNLWILGSGPLQIFNTEKRALVDDYEFPDRNASEVFDLDGVGQSIYMVTSSGLDNFPLVKSTGDKKLKNYLLYVKVNNQAVEESTARKLSYAENNIIFNIGVPAYLKAKDIYIKYCLATKGDSTWQTTEPGERSIHFSSLMPGKYTLKAIAVDPRVGEAGSVINYSFTIQEPWWRSTAFKLALTLAAALAIFYGYVIMLRKRLALKRAFDTQQQLILSERQRIASEMHDDIGPGVFAIQNLANKAIKHENAAPELHQIKTQVVELSAKIHDVIWSTNVGNDNLEMLLYYIHVQIEKLLEPTEIVFDSELPDEIPAIKITVQSRRTVYLLVKEIVHNAIKHSQATTIQLRTIIEGDKLLIAVNDNGVGIDAAQAPTKGDGHGMGLGNMRSRVEKLNGELSIQNNHGAHISIKIPLDELRVVEFDKKLNKWQSFVAKLLRLPADV